VLNFGDISALSNVKWFVVITITLSSLVASPVQVSRHIFLETSPAHLGQAYFTWRAWVVSGKAWYATPPWVAEFVRMVIVFVNCGYLAQDKSLGDFRTDHGYLVTTTLVSCLCVSRWHNRLVSALKDTP
jgi:hypothetical protein